MSDPKSVTSIVVRAIWRHVEAELRSLGYPVEMTLTTDDVRIVIDPRGDKPIVAAAWSLQQAVEEAKRLSRKEHP